MEEIQARYYARNLIKIEIQTLNGSYKPKGAEAAALWEYLAEQGFSNYRSGTLTEAGKLVAKYL
jgi:hypothetical protein